MKEPEKWRNREWEIKKGEPLINKVTLREINPAWATYAEQEIERLRALVQVKKEIRLPTFEECKSHLKDGLTALEVLIYDNEPAGTEDSERFREQLLCALREVLSLAKEGKE